MLEEKYLTELDGVFRPSDGLLTTFIAESDILTCPRKHSSCVQLLIPPVITNSVTAQGYLNYGGTLETFVKLRQYLPMSLFTITQW